MGKDISLMIDNVKLNIRVGVIFKYHDEVLIELSSLGYNSVIPGGRLKINEKTYDTAIREIREEMSFNIEKDKLSYLGFLEEFFEIQNIPYHELYFIYNYLVNDNDYQKLKDIKKNLDNTNNYYEFIKINKLKEVNLLPEKLIEMIKAL